MAEKWEYTVVDTVIGAYRNTENQLAEWFPNLNALGDVGWEVVSAVVIHARGTNATHDGVQHPMATALIEAP